MVWGNLTLYHLCKCLLTLCHNLFVRKDNTKYYKQWYGGKLRQTMREIMLFIGKPKGRSRMISMVDSWYCLHRFVPEVISQVSRRSEVGNTKRRSLNTRLSSGTSAGTFAVSVGPCRNYHAKAGTKNEPWHVFGTIPKKGLENRSSRFKPKNSWLSFSRGSGPPLSSKVKSLVTMEGWVILRVKSHWTMDISAIFCRTAKSSGWL